MGLFSDRLLSLGLNSVQGIPVAFALLLFSASCGVLGLSEQPNSDIGAQAKEQASDAVPEFPATVSISVGRTIAVSKSEAIQLHSSENELCPCDVVCVHAGRAVAELTLLERGTAQGSVTLTLGTMGEGHVQETALGSYRVHFENVLPNCATPDAEAGAIVTISEH